MNLIELNLLNWFEFNSGMSNWIGLNWIWFNWDELDQI